MTDIAVDVSESTAALDRGRAEVENAAGQAQVHEPQSSDPKIAELLRALSEQTGGAAGRAEEHTATGAAAAEGLAETDAESASSAAATPAAAPPGSPSSSRVSSATLGPSNAAANQQQSLLAQQQQQSQQVAAQQQAQQMVAAQQAQQQMVAAQQAQQQMMMAAAQQAASVAAPAASLGGMPAGTILVDPNDLAGLIDSVSSGSASGSSTESVWTGSTAREPIDVNDVQYDKTHGPLSKSEVSAVIDSAMDKTGIEDPAARAKWKFVLEHMSDSESTNNPSAVNNHDINAVGAIQVDGSPANSSRGQWQTVPTTFAAYHAAGTSTNIYDPEASAGAAINYMKDRYDIGADGSGLDEFYAARAHGKYVGY